MNIKRRKKAVTASTRKGATCRSATSITATVSYTPYRKKDLRTLEDEWGWESGELVSAVRDGERQLGAKFVGFTDDEDTYFVFKKGDDLVVYDSPEFGFWTPVEASTRKLPRRRILAADSDYIKIGNRILPRNTAGMRDEASYAEVSREGKRRYDAEQEEKRLAAEKAAKLERGRAGAAAFNRIFEKHEGEPNRDGLWNDLFDEFVPGEGAADTMGGEIIRAVNRVIYRWENDGDKFNQGYGLETCASDAAFLAENTDSKIEKIIAGAAELDPGAPDELYSAAMEKLEEAVIEYLANNPEVFGEDSIDSREFDSYLIDEWNEMSHCLEYEPDTSGEYLDRLIEADCINYDDVDQLLCDWAEYDAGGEVNRWAQDAWTITNLDIDQFNEWNDNFERWWNQTLDEWMNEYEDQLIAYEEGEEDEDEYDEDEEE